MLRIVPWSRGNAAVNYAERCAYVFGRGVLLWVAVLEGVVVIVRVLGCGAGAGLGVVVGWGVGLT